MVVAVEEQSALLRVAMLVARGMRLEELFAHVCEESARLLGVDATGVLRYIGGERAVIVGVWRTGGVRGLPVNAELDFDDSDSAIGRALATKRARAGLQLRPRPRRAAGPDALGRHERLGRRAGAASTASRGARSWPRRSEEEALPPGLRAAARRARRAASAQALVNAAGGAELAASRTRLVEAGDETRRRLERELHEGAHQHVVALALKLRVALGRADPGLRGGRGAARRARRRDGGVSAELSELARGLHPAVLSERGPRGGAAGRRGAERAAREPARAARPALSARDRDDGVPDGGRGARQRRSRTRTPPRHAARGRRGDTLIVEMRDNGIGGARRDAGRRARGASRDRAGAIGAGRSAPARPAAPPCGSRSP